MTFRNVPMKGIHLSINDKRDLEVEKVDLSTFSFSLTKKIIKETLFDLTDFSFFDKFLLLNKLKMFLIVNPNLWIFLLMIEQLSGK